MKSFKTIFVLLSIIALLLGCSGNNRNNNLSIEDVIERDTTSKFNAYNNYYLGIPQADNIKTALQDSCVALKDTYKHTQRNACRIVSILSLNVHSDADIVELCRYLNVGTGHDYFSVSEFMRFNEYEVESLAKDLRDKRIAPSLYIDQDLESYYRTSVIIPIDENGTLSEYKGWFKLDSFNDTTYSITCVFNELFSVGDELEYRPRFNALARAISKKLQKDYSIENRGKAMNSYIWNIGKYEIELWPLESPTYNGYTQSSRYVDYEYIITYTDKKIEKRKNAVEARKRAEQKAKEQARLDSIKQVEQYNLREKQKANHL